LDLLKRRKRNLHYNEMKYCLLNHKYGKLLKELIIYIGSAFS